MEKLICSACGATIAPSITTPYLVCEYCGTAIENKYYSETAAEAARQEAQQQEAVQAAAEAAAQTAEEEPNLVEKLLNAGKEKLTDKIEQLTGLDLDGEPETVTCATVPVYTQPLGYSQQALYTQPAMRPVPARPRQTERRRKQPVQQPRPVQMARPRQVNEPGQGSGRGMQYRPAGRPGQGGPGGRGQGGPGGRRGR